MVIAAAKRELFILLLDPFADGRRLGEVERRAHHRADLASGDQGVVDRGKLRGVKHQLMIENGIATLALQVEVTVLGKIDWRCFVRHGTVIHH